MRDLYLFLEAYYSIKLESIISPLCLLFFTLSSVIFLLEKYHLVLVIIAT